jgi:hypothetical protein
MADVVRIDADDGKITPYATAFRDRLVFDAFDGDFPAHRVVGLLGDDAAAGPVAAALAGGPGYVTGVGHGEYGAFTGTDRLAVWDPGSDLSALGGAIVHLLSCQTGSSLGPRMIKAGARAFWGYSVDFEFFFQRDPPADLADDATAEVYFRMDVIIDRGVLAGRTAQEIYDSVSRYVAAVVPQLTGAQRVVLLSNYVHLVWPGLNWGDPDATV